MGPLRDLNPNQRMLLLKFVCSFAWADGILAPQERAMVVRFVESLDLIEEEHAQIEAWFESPTLVLLGCKASEMNLQPFQFFICIIKQFFKFSVYRYLLDQQISGHQGMADISNN